MKAMILAAGLGTRLRPLTDKKPKALVEINGVTLLEITLHRLKFFGFNDIVINVHHFADLIIGFLEQYNHFGLNINISDETNLLLDTGGGIKHARQFLEGPSPFLVQNVDVLTTYNLARLYKTHTKHQSTATLLVQPRESSRQLLFNSEMNLKGWENLNTGEQLLVSPESSGSTAYQRRAFCGVHVIDPVIFKLLPARDVFSIIPAYLKIAETNQIRGVELGEHIWMDVGKPSQLEEARQKNLENSEEFIK